MLPLPSWSKPIDPDQLLRSYFARLDARDVCFWHLADVYAVVSMSLCPIDFASRLGMIELAQSRAERHKNVDGHLHVVALAGACSAGLWPTEGTGRGCGRHRHCRAKAH